jgi:hypothetical protein
MQDREVIEKIRLSGFFLDESFCDRLWMKTKGSTGNFLLAATYSSRTLIYTDNSSGCR